MTTGSVSNDSVKADHKTPPVPNVGLGNLARLNPSKKGDLTSKKIMSARHTSQRTPELCPSSPLHLDFRADA